jgi:hypothetical protein
VFAAPFDVLFSDFDVVEPDLLYLSKERAAGVLTPKHARGAPELVAEIGSKSTRKRDETIKRRLYERSGVAEYWLIDPQLDVVKVYRRVGEGYQRVAELAMEHGDVLTTQLLPGLDLPLAKIFKARRESRLFLRAWLKPSSSTAMEMSRRGISSSPRPAPVPESWSSRNGGASIPESRRWRIALVSLGSWRSRRISTTGNWPVTLRWTKRRA